jgi:hypothetical protein
MLTFRRSPPLNRAQARNGPLNRAAVRSRSVDNSIASTAMATGSRRPVSATSVRACQTAPRTASNRNAHGRIPAAAPACAAPLSIRTVINSRRALFWIGSALCVTATRRGRTRRSSRATRRRSTPRELPGPSLRRQTPRLAKESPRTSRRPHHRIQSSRSRHLDGARL